MSANSAKNPTSSSSTPTATTSAPTVPELEVLPEVKTVVINDGEEVQVDSRSGSNYFLLDPHVINSSVFKCSNCKYVTVHDGFEVAGFPTGTTPVTTESVKSKRLYLCTNCGKFSTK